MSLSSGGGPSGGGVGGSGGGNNGSGGGGPSSSSFTHFHKNYNRNYSQSYMNTTATTSSGSISSNDEDGDAFTSVMRDRQARGKDPYHSGDGSEGSDLSDQESGATPSKLRLVGGGGGRPEKEDFARTELRQKAIAFLDNPELLMMYAQSTGDSIPGARLHFMRILCGYDEIPHHSSGSKASSSASRFANRPDHPRQHSHNSHNIGEKRRR
ncbi:hypothetical protein QBC36DRAFT_129398 [Triangularia setosa]|uniref:Uncharacterized protein n=1 Tax=Triangularia setosa TaxID=2587417 RepID=A0AAN6WFJ7_9PEZI|nr:hypothetical protein QBC36DRAFT_129398 [Podospora setosa]